jgi:hypothetical protein
MPRELSDDECVCAYLNDENVPVLCDLGTFLEWNPRNQERCQIRKDELNGWTVETCFSGMSFVQDGPPLFWKTVACPPHGQRPREYKSGTLENALMAHDFLLKEIRDSRI